MKIINFLFQKNLWTLDFITTICFATYVGYKVNTGSLIGINEETRWNRVFLEVLAYVFTFFLAFILQRQYPWMRSWFWLAVVGALLRILFITAVDFRGSLHDLIVGVIFNWIFCSVIGLICIFGVRFLAYPFWFFYTSRDKYKSGFPGI